MEKDTIQTRFCEAVEQILSQDKTLTKTKLAESLGCGRTKLSEILAGRMMAGTDVIAQLCKQYHISSEWILLGINDNPDDTHTPDDTAANATATPLPIARRVEQGGIPLIPIEAMAGFASGNDTSVLEYECEHYVVPLFRNADFLIPVKGSSMIPKYNSGDLVACKILTMHDIFFQWNHVYVLDTDQGALIKRVQPADNDNYITCVSDNENYPPFTLRRDQIHSIAIVVGVIRLE